MLLAKFGYDVVGLDLSETAIKEARENEKRVREMGWKGYEEVGNEAEIVGTGRVEWISGDFLDEGTLGDRKFDLIFDYTVSFTIH